MRGRVQGISYQDACIRGARAMGITGWVRNRMDGSVKVMLQGFHQRSQRTCAVGCVMVWPQHRSMSLK